MLAAGFNPSPQPSSLQGERRTDGARPIEVMNPILALDFGRARIGAAISDELQLLAHPLETIPANEQAPSRIAAIAREKKVDHVVRVLTQSMNRQIGVAGTADLDV